MDGLLETLLRMGKITEEDLLEAEKLNPSPQMVALVDTIHSTFCEKCGNDKEEDEFCSYYEEKVLDSRWSEPASQQWLTITQNFLTHLDTNHKALLGAFGNCIDLLSKVTPVGRRLLPYLLSPELFRKFAGL